MVQNVNIRAAERAHNVNILKAERAHNVNILVAERESGEGGLEIRSCLETGSGFRGRGEPGRFLAQKLTDWYHAHSVSTYA